MFLEDDIDISKIELKKLVNFLPYPIIITENVGGEYFYSFFNKNFIKKIGYRTSEVPAAMDLLKLMYPDDHYRNEILRDWTSKENRVKQAGKGFIKIKAPCHLQVRRKKMV